MLRGRLSTSERIVAPVVVKPEALSKKASVKDGMYPEITNGRAPARLAVIQQNATETKLARGERKNFFFRPARKSEIPRIKQITAGIRNAGITAVSPQKKAVPAGKIMVRVTSAKTIPFILKAESKLTLILQTFPLYAFYLLNTR